LAEQLHTLAEAAIPQGTLEQRDGNPVSLTYNGVKHMLIADTYRADIVRFITSKPPEADKIEMYKSFGLLPKDFPAGYNNGLFGTWEGWLTKFGGPEHTGATLSSEDVKKLRATMGEVVRIAQTPLPVVRPRFSSTAIRLFKQLGLRPMDVGITNRENWDTY
jgi:hypothetical protein